MDFLKDDPKILITGITSIHGWPIYKKLMTVFPGESILAVGSPKMNFPSNINVHRICITDKKRLEQLYNSFKPTHVIHCGGVCDLDVCEARPHWAQRMNVGGARAIMDVFGASCHITYASSDLVFSGIAPPSGGYKENHKPDPISVVGRTFLEAEKELSQCDKSCIVRLGLPLGDSFTGDKGAVDWIESRFKRGLPVTLFFDEIRSCISCDELAEKVLKLVIDRARGVFHCGGRKTMSLFDIGRQVLGSGPYPPKLLKKASRLNDIGGPPRVGDVSLDSLKLAKYIKLIHTPIIYN